ncbi:MAG TPA: hypothetical protein VIY48_01730 [Candidatus Paceibacterota bacterium]
MAGSYDHAVNEQTGQLRNWRHMTIATETQGDAYETIEEMYGMIWWLACGDPVEVEDARQHYLSGLKMSPGKEPEDLRYEDEDEK